MNEEQVVNPIADFVHSHFSQIQFDSLNPIYVVFLLGLLIFLGSFGGRLFQKLKIPQVVGYIVIGIILGISGTKILGDDLVKSLNPISTIALTFIGFLVGAELKLDVIKKYGKQFIGILFGETLVPFFVVGSLVTGLYYLIGNDMAIPGTEIVFSKGYVAVSMGLLLGAICTATAPAATTDVLKEYRTKGPLTTIILGIVAMDDAIALILYTIAAAVAKSLLTNPAELENAAVQSAGIASKFGSIGFEIFGSIALGLIVGFILIQIIKGMMNDDGRVLGFSIGALFLCTGICELAEFEIGSVECKFDNILAAMSVGFCVANFSLPKVKNMFKLVEKYTPPVYVLFFVTVGAKLDIWKLEFTLVVIAVTYVLGRTIGKTIGSRLGARLTKAPETVRKYLPFCLLSQAGVAIGLSISASNDFQYTDVGNNIALIITATTFIVQVLGPICVKYGVTKAGEVGLDVNAEDIMKKAVVKDVSVNGVKIIGSQSYSVVDDVTMIGQIIRSFSTHENTNYCVRGADGKICGQISLEHLKEAICIGEMGELLLAMDIMETPAVTCSPEMSLPDAYQLFEDHDIEAICVINENDEPLGILEKYTVDHYLHNELIELNKKLASMA